MQLILSIKGWSVVGLGQESGMPQNVSMLAVSCGGTVYCQPEREGGERKEGREGGREGGIEWMYIGVCVCW